VRILLHEENRISKNYIVPDKEMLLIDTGNNTKQINEIIGQNVERP